jgi:hypothetical protein
MSSTIHVVTPCMNAIDTIDRTIQSVVTQAGRFRIRYHVQDGGSSDGTVERLRWWKSQLDNPHWPRLCAQVEFTFRSEPDAGMYDAIVRGMDRVLSPDDDFITWINADDVFMVGAFAAVNAVFEQFPRERASWVCGTATIMKDDLVITSYDRRLPTAAIRAGLCDGKHWPFVQQEGTFFRRWLWDAVKPHNSIRPLKLAGDWNLWRLFAAQSSLTQFTMALAAFRVRDQQMSSRLRDRYMAEIESIVPESARREALEVLAREGTLRRRFQSTFPDTKLVVIEEECNEQLKASCKMALPPERLVTVTERQVKRVLFEGDPNRRPGDGPGPDTSAFSLVAGVAAHDRDWQFPAITEKHAFACIRAQGGAPSGVVYVAFPWATLIDKLQTRAADAAQFLALFRAFIRFLPPEGRRVTVCQHVLMRRFMVLFEDAGIHHIFWSHATVADRTPTEGDPEIHPFPLYPVQLPAEDGEHVGSDDARPYLFSFIGARPDRFYLTQVRAWILDDLKGEPDGLIVGRDGWHYQKVVYDHQVLRTGNASAGAAPLVDDKTSVEFQKSLRSSTFSLCPSGSGPNSIRLWESIGAGSVPVIMADTYQPPGPRALWEQAAVFCDETPEAVRALPARLRALAAEPGRLVEMRQAMQQLWLLYGPGSFVSDIQSLMYRLNPPGTRAPGSALPAWQGFDGLAERFAGELAGNDAQFLLNMLGARILTVPGFGRAATDDGGPVQRLYRRALAQLPPQHAARRQFEQVLSFAVAARDRSGPQAFSISRARGPRVALIGRHSHRTPLSYAPIRRHIGDALSLVDDPRSADVLVAGFDIDLFENAALISELKAKNPRLPLVVLSEEPLWDLTWSRSRGAPRAMLATETGPFEYVSLNHETSTIFRFAQLPYFILTNDDYLSRYRALLAPTRRRTAQQMAVFWGQRERRSAYYLEKRVGPAFEKRESHTRMYGLSAYRTRLAESVCVGHIARVGKGWGQAHRRQDLVDWHLDKLASIAGVTHLCSAIENVHHADYISEKIFDAYAAGAVPVYFAEPGHRIDELIPEASYINVAGSEPDAAALMVDRFAPGSAFFERHAVTQNRLHRALCDWDVIASERSRIAAEVVSALNAQL